MHSLHDSSNKQTKYGDKYRDYTCQWHLLRSIFSGMFLNQWWWTHSSRIGGLPGFLRTAIETSVQHHSSHLCSAVRYEICMAEFLLWSKKCWQPSTISTCDITITTLYYLHLYCVVRRWKIPRFQFCLWENWKCMKEAHFWHEVPAPYSASL